MTRPDISRGGGWILSLGLIGMVLGAFWLMRRGGDGSGARVAPVSVLPDGAQVQVLGLTFGTEHVLTLGRFPGLDPWRQRIPWLRRLWGPRTERVSGGANRDGMCVFYTVRDGAGQPMPEPPWLVACYDEHGCRMEIDSSRGSTTLSQGLVVHQLTTLYPRRLEAVEVELGASGGGDGRAVGAGRVVLKNPRPWVGTNWVPEPVPAVREVDGLRVTFEGYGGNDAWPSPKFRVEQGGEERREWRAGRVVFRDVTGNESHSPRLCRHESAWQIEVSFEREAGFPFGPEEVWTLWEGDLPMAGEVSMLRGGRTLQGVQASPLALGGPGRFEFEKRGVVWRLVRAEPLAEGGTGNSSSWGSDSQRQWLTMARVKPWLMLNLAGVTSDLTWQLITRDMKGGVHPSRGWSASGSMHTVAVELPEGEEVRELQLIVQRLRTVAFTVAPPKIAGQ